MKCVICRKRDLPSEMVAKRDLPGFGQTDICHDCWRYIWAEIIMVCASIVTMAQEQE